MVKNLKNILCGILFISATFICYCALASEHYLNLVYPANGATINANSTFFVGATNPKAKLTINDKPVDVYANGAFVWVYALQKGKNNIILKSTYKNNVREKNISINVPEKIASTNTSSSTLEPFTTPIIITEKEAPLRKTPYGSRLTPCKEGMVCETVGVLNNHYKVKYGNECAYIMKPFAKADCQKCVAKQIANKILFNENDKNIIVKIPLTQPKLAKINSYHNTLKVNLVDTKFAFENVVTKSPYIKDFKFNDNSFTITTTAKELNGYDYYYDNNTFILNIKKPFKTGIKGKIIAIDAGHGGKECGSIGPTGVTEKTINLAISKYLKAELEKSGAKVVMIRDNDCFVDLYDRVDMAQKKDADILISIHNNALPDGQNPYETHGTETYYFQPQAISLAKCVQKNLLKANGFNNLGVKYSSFVLTRPTTPVSILVEVGFMINPYEYSQLLQASNQKKYAIGIKNGVEEYFRTR